MKAFAGSAKTQNDIVNGVISIAPRVCKGFTAGVLGENPVTFDFIGTGFSITIKSGVSISKQVLDLSFTDVAISGTSPDFLLVFLA